jgi:hypothetical protein
MRNNWETQAQQEFLLLAPERMPRVRLFRRQVMVAQTDGRWMKAGIKGQCDLYGLLRGGGHIEIELKSYGGTLSKEQIRWQAFCSSWGVPHVVLRGELNEAPEAASVRWCGALNAFLGEIGARATPTLRPTGE